MTQTQQARATNGRGVLAHGDADRGMLVRRQLSVLDRGGPRPRGVLRHHRVRPRPGPDPRRRRLRAQPGADRPHPRQCPGRQLGDRGPGRRARHARAAGPAAGRVHRQARRAPGRRGAADRNGEGRGVRPDQPPRRGRDRTLRIPGMVETEMDPYRGRTGASPPYRTRSSPRCRAPPPGWPRPACTGSTCPSTA